MKEGNMSDSKINGNYLDYYSVNEDFSGTRKVKNTQEDVQFYSDSSMRIWYNTQAEGFDPHWHSALEIIMPVENYYEVDVCGQLYHILPGEILFIPPGELHTLYAPDSGKRFIFLFDLSSLASLKGFAGIQSLLVSPLYVTKESYPGVYDEIYQLLVAMRNEYFGQKEYAELTVYSLLLSLFVKFGYNRINTGMIFPNVRLYKQKEYIQKFNNLLDYIDSHFMEELSLEEIADATGFSKFHFSRLFKQYTGFTFCDYLCHRRIKEAEELLSQPDLSVTEVALRSGFPSISTFNRLFKQQKSCTPSEYRTKNGRGIRRHGA